VDDDLAELAVEEVKDYLAATTFADVPVIPVSGITGRGVPELRAALVAKAREVRPRELDERPFRQAVDRVFSLTGAGTVVPVPEPSSPGPRSGGDWRWGPKSHSCLLEGLRESGGCMSTAKSASEWRPASASQ
jgi:hypothetical protein